MVTRWKFDDPVSLVSHTFEVNPSAGGTPAYERNITTQSTSAPDGKVIVFEGRDQPQTFEFSGTLRSEEELDVFVEWFNKRYQIKVTDDLGREHMIVIQSFRPTRERAATAPWKHSYTVSAVIVDWP